MTKRLQVQTPAKSYLSKTLKMVLAALSLGAPTALRKIELGIRTGLLCPYNVTG